MSEGERHTSWKLLSTIGFVTLLLIVVACLGVSWFVRVMQVGKVDGCAANLSQLAKLDQMYRAEFGSLNASQIGKAYWLRLQSFKPELHRASALFCCPFREEPKPGRCDYLGPAIEFSKMDDGGYLGCDEEGNHGICSQGMVVRKAGDVAELDGEDWGRFLKEKRCVP
jgi:hypothetical protein